MRRIDRSAPVEPVHFTADARIRLRALYAQ